VRRLTEGEDHAEVLVVTVSENQTEEEALAEAYQENKTQEDSVYKYSYARHHREAALNDLIFSDVPRRVFFKSKWHFVKNNDWRENNLAWTSHRKTREAVALPMLVYAFLLSGVLPLVAALFFSAMLSGHLPLALHNVTSIEMSFDNMANPFDHRNAIKNLEQVLGRAGLDWFLPFGPCQPITSGISFPRHDDPMREDGDAPREMTSLLNQENESGEGGEDPEHDLWRRRYGATH
jgi:hypothetical protein